MPMRIQRVTYLLFLHRPLLVLFGFHAHLTRGMKTSAADGGTTVPRLCFERAQATPGWSTDIVIMPEGPACIYWTKVSADTFVWRILCRRGWRLRLWGDFRACRRAVAKEANDAGQSFDPLLDLCM